MRTILRWSSILPSLDNAELIGAEAWEPAQATGASSFGAALGTALVLTGEIELGVKAAESLADGLEIKNCLRHL